MVRITILALSMIWLADCDAQGKMAEQQAREVIVKMLSDREHRSVAGIDNIKMVGDPDSVQLRALRPGNDASESEEAYCGELNFKNEYGVYTGFSKFALTYIKPDHLEKEYSAAPPQKVSEAQEFLKETSYYNGPISGKWDTRTRTAFFEASMVLFIFKEEDKPLDTTFSELCEVK